MYSDWEALQPQLRERGYRLHTLRDWPERTLALLEDGVELEEAELDKIYQNVGSVCLDRLPFAAILEPVLWTKNS